MLHNEKEYPDPLAFKPERFLKDGKINPEVQSPMHIAFGLDEGLSPLPFVVKVQVTDQYRI